jgi:hypothetical protein
MHEPMNAGREASVRTTLLELVGAVTDSGSSDAETVAVLRHWMDGGRLSLHEGARGWPHTRAR